jgi:D-proline reductase (dithiol) PrdB
LIQGYPFRRIALITTAGFHLPGQIQFDQSYRHDDCSFREIPWGTPVQTLQIGQSSDAFDHSGIEADRNLALPLDRLRELVEAGVVGEAAPRQFSIMGSLIAPALLISESGPEIARKLKEDAVDAVISGAGVPLLSSGFGIAAKHH